ncbi:MAG: hypothetical protein WCG75_11025 [Armatimonadota bacterium]
MTNFDFRQEITKRFKEAMARHNLTKSALEVNGLKFVVTHGYRKSEQLLVVGCDMYCKELWMLLNRPDRVKEPIYQFVVGHLIGLKDAVIQLDDGLNIEDIEAYFEEMIGKGVAPLVAAVQTPRQAVEYAIKHRIVMLFGPALKNEMLGTWAKHFGIDFVPPN